MMGWNLGPGFKGSPSCWSVNSDSQAVVGKKTANFGEPVLN